MGDNYITKDHGDFLFKYTYFDIYYEFIIAFFKIFRKKKYFCCFTVLYR